MRISTDVNDPGYRDRSETRRFVVFLDGEPVRDCVMADDEVGLVQVLVSEPVEGHSRRQLVLDGDKLKMELRYGKVVIQRRNPDGNAASGSASE